MAFFIYQVCQTVKTDLSWHLALAAQAMTTHLLALIQELQHLNAQHLNAHRAAVIALRFTALHTDQYLCA